MIDHISISVRDLARAGRLFPCSIGRHRLSNARGAPAHDRLRQAISRVLDQPTCSDGAACGRLGTHVALRVRAAEMVDAFHAAALAAGGASDGAPGLRPQHGQGYYAAFIRDLDGNRIEAVTFLQTQQ